MRGDPQANARLLAAVPGPRWPAWVVLARERRERNRQAKLEVIERLAAEQRRALRAGEHGPVRWYRS